MSLATKPTLVPWWELFEQAWKTWRTGATPPAWECFLPADAAGCDPEHLVFALRIDIAFRVKAGIPATLSESYFRHPLVASLDAEQCADLVRWEYQQRWENGQRARREDYLSAFPDLADKLADLRPRWDCPSCHHAAITMDDETTGALDCPKCASSFPAEQVFAQPTRADSAVLADSRPRLESPTPDAPPAAPPGYELLERIGQGGMGVVYRARDLAIGRDVAVKFLHSSFSAKSSAAGRFLEEARITGQLQHPGIPAVHQVGQLPDGRPYLAMKLIKGRTLHELLNGRGEKRGQAPFPPILGSDQCSLEAEKLPVPFFAPLPRRTGWPSSKRSARRSAMPMRIASFIAT